MVLGKKIYKHTSRVAVRRVRHTDGTNKASFVAATVANIIDLQLYISVERTWLFRRITCRAIDSLRMDILEICE